MLNNQQRDRERAKDTTRRKWSGRPHVQGVRVDHTMWYAVPSAHKKRQDHSDPLNVGLRPIYTR
jgi:hypothetical protein